MVCTRSLPRVGLSMVLVFGWQLLAERAVAAGEAPPAAVAGLRDDLLVELADLGDGLARLDAGCRAGAGEAPERSDVCARARPRWQESAALAAEVRLAPAGHERADVAARLERWRWAVQRLRLELAELERRAAVDAFEEPPPLLGGAPLEGGLGTIEGRITDETSGEPLAFVSVFVFRPSGFAAGFGFSDAQGDYEVGGLTAGQYYAHSDNFSGYVDEVYDDVVCAPFCEPLTGTPITVPAGGTTAGIDFPLAKGGAISGTVTGSGKPLADARVSIWTASGEFLTSGSTDSSGVYVSARGLLTGAYFATTTNEDSFLNELYDGLPCPYLQACVVTTGTPIAVTQGATTSGIDFDLAPGGAVSGTVTIDGTGRPLGSFVDVYDTDALLVTTGFSSGAGDAWVSEDGLPTGTYYARTFESDGIYVNEIYDDVPCIGACDVTVGTPIAVVVGGTTSGIDFALAPGGGIAGTVTSDVTGLPVQSLRIDLFDASGTPVTSFFSGFNGTFANLSGLPAGIYYARTLHARNHGFAEERFNDLPCSSFCPATSGTPITVTAGAVTSGVDFALGPRALHFDSFESGGLGYWDGGAGGLVCGHSMCNPGTPLSAACDPCVEAICLEDELCCTGDWDGFCIFQVGNLCGLECP